jgi:SH3-like domain-containing protein
MTGFADALERLAAGDKVRPNINSSGAAVSRIGLIAIAIACIASSAAADAEERKIPYWASLATGDALMRTGPEKTFPAIWRYRRRDLPIQVVQVYGDWRRIKEIDGTEGWMLSTLLSARRTGVITGQGLAPMRADPDDNAGLNWQAEPGVVGNLEECDGSWCRFNVGGKKGYVRAERIWGVSPGEQFEE